MITGLSSIRLASYRRYASVVRFIMADSIGVLRWRGFVASGLTLGGPVLQVVVLATVLYYASAITAGGDRDLLGWSVNVRDSFSLLVLVSSVSLVLLLISGVLRWLGGIFAADARIRLERVYGRRVMKHVLLWYDAPGLSESTGEIQVSKVVSVCRRDAKLVSRVVLGFYLTIPPLMLSIGALATLLVISAPLTFGLLPILIGAFLFLSRVGVNGSRASSRYEETTGEVAREYRRMISERRVIEESDWNPSAIASFGFFASRLKVVAHANLISDLVLALLVSAALIALGPGGLWGFAGWESLLVYLFAMRIFQANLKKVATRFSAGNRFHSNVVRLARILRSRSGSPRRNRSIASIPIEVRGADSGSGMELEPGSRMVVLHVGGISPLNAGSVARGLSSAGCRPTLILDQLVVAEDSLGEAIETASRRDRWIILVDVETTLVDSGDDMKSAEMAVLHICRGPDEIPVGLKDLPVLVIDSVDERGPVALYLPGEIAAAGDMARLLAAPPLVVDADEHGDLAAELELDDS